MAASIPPLLSSALAEGGGLISAIRCRELGVSADRVERMLRSGLLLAAAKGIYADRRHVDGLSDWAVFRLRTRAFVMASPPDTHASDWSAVALHHLPTRSEPPRVPSAIRLGSRGSGSNRTPHGRTRFAAVADRWLTEVDGTATLRPAFVAVDLARGLDRRSGLVLADGAAGREGSLEDLERAERDMALWPHLGRARWAVSRASIDVESPLESVGRYAFLRAGLPPGASNVWVGEDIPCWRLDHYWADQRLAAEADGMAKYGLFGDPMAALRAEKEREWQLQEWGIRVVRYTWTTAAQTPDVLAGRVRSLLSAPPLPADRPFRTWSRRDGFLARGMTPPAVTWAAATPRPAAATVSRPHRPAASSWSSSAGASGCR